MNLIDINNELDVDVFNLKECELLFITGAGISAADPCCLFLGDEIYNCLLNNYTIDCSLSNKLIKNNISFEEACNYLYKKYENQVNNRFNQLLLNLFVVDFNNRNKANDYHKYFSNHIKNGGIHFTANLDQYIEESIANNFSSYQITTTSKINIPNSISVYKTNGLLLKIHEDPNDTPFGEHGFLSKIIKNGFPPYTKNFWYYFLNKVKLVVFVGYGFVDVFDVIPFFKEMPEKYLKSKALFLSYSRDTTIKKEFPNSNEYAILKSFNRYLKISVSPEIVLNNLFSGKYILKNVHRNNFNIESYIKYFSCNHSVDILEKVENTIKLLCYAR